MEHDVCIVVGVGPNLGLAIARRFGVGGFRLALMARQRDRLEAMCRGLREEGIVAEPFTVDARVPGAISPVLQAIETRMGPAGVLVYNAASQEGSSGRTSDVPLERLRSSLEINVVSMVLAVQAVLPAMRGAGSGTVLLTGGGWGLEPSPAHVPLGIGKAAVRSVSFSLAKEVEPDGIHAATVTICGSVVDNTDHAAALMAEQYWQLHIQKKPWDWEVQV